MKRALMATLVMLLVLLPALATGQPFISLSATNEVRTVSINGALAYLGKIGGDEPYSLLGAYGPNVHTFWEDFNHGLHAVASTSIDSTGYGGASDLNIADYIHSINKSYTWIETRVEAGTGDSRAIISDSAAFGSATPTNGVLWLDPAANDNDGVNLQTSAGAFELSTSNGILYFGARIGVVDSATQSDLFVGLADVKTTLVDTTLDDGIGFWKKDGSTSLEFLSKKNSTATHGTVATVSADTWYLVEFWVDQRPATPLVRYYIDGEYVGTHSANIPNDVPLRVSLAYLNGSATMQHKGLFVDWVHIAKFNP